MNNKIVFTLDDGQDVDLFVVEQTRINGINYLLVTDGEGDDAQAFILKDTSAADESDALYEEVIDDIEFEAVTKVFDELLDDVDFE